MRKFLCLLLLALIVSVTGCSSEELKDTEYDTVTDTAAAPAVKGLTVLYTGDVHSAVSAGVGYQGLADLRSALIADGRAVILADCGDAIQGGLEGDLSEGGAVVTLMNTAGYDVAGFGVHEFDFGLDRVEELMKSADYGYVCCNLVDASGESLLAPYRIIDRGGYRVAFIGVICPDAISCSDIFAGSGIPAGYSLCGEDSGQALYAQVQKCVDRARQAGADYVFVLSHLGTESTEECWTSRSLIAATGGIDAVLDSRSHAVIDGEKVTDKDGKAVLLTAAGSRFEYLGALSISAEGELSCRLLGSADTADFAGHSLAADAAMQQAIEAVEADTQALTEQVIAHSAYALATHTDAVQDSEGNPMRIIRSQETNLGDLIADAVRYSAGADIGVINGASIEASINAGDITTADILTVLPQAHDMAVIEATGSQILDALEYSVSRLPDASAAFLQVSGLTYSVDLNNASTVITDDSGAFAGVEGKRRILSCQVSGSDIEKDVTYAVAGPAYILRDGGEGYTMFAGCSVLSGAGMTDAQMLLDYLTGDLEGSVPDRYSEVYGLGRIRMTRKTILSESAIEDAIAYARKAKESRPTNWQHYCAKFCNDCYQYGAKIKVVRQPTARELGDHLITHTGKHPPAGAFVFWYKGEDKYGHPGHVALSLGDGMIVHPFPDLVITSIDYPEEHGYIYRGWGAPLKDYIFEEELYY